MIVGRDRGSHAPTPQVGTPTRGSTQICKISQTARNPIGMRISIFSLQPPGRASPEGTVSLSFMFAFYHGPWQPDGDGPHPNRGAGRSAVASRSNLATSVCGSGTPTT